MKYKIYKLICPKTNKVRYIGLTQRTLEQRLSNHIRESYGKQKHTHKSNWIRGLILNSLMPKIRLICECDSLQEAYELEKLHISQNINLTNLTLGGEGTFGHKASKEWLEKVSCKNNMHDLNGKFLKSFNSLSEAARFINGNSKHLSAVCSGKKRSYKKYVFRYFGDSFNKYNVESFRGKNNPNIIKVYQYTKNLKFIKAFSCMLEASIKTKSNKSHLLFCVNNPFKNNGKRRICNNFIFLKSKI